MMKDRTLLIIGVIFLLVYLSPYIVLGEDVRVRIHDNLDSNLIWYKTLAESGKVFAPNDAEIPTMMNGLPRTSLDSEFKLYVLLFSLFDPFTAYAINAFLMRFVAFFGMYLLLKKHVLKRYNPNPIITVGVALVFALMPFWPFGGLSIAGIPLALYAFWNIRNHTAGKKDWLIIGLMPFYSNFILSFIFFLGLMGLVWLVDLIREKRPNWKFLAGIAMMTALYLAKLYRLVIDMLLGEGFTPHRQEFSLGHNSFSRTIGLWRENFLTAHTHSESLHQPVILYVVLFALLIVVVRGVYLLVKNQTETPRPSPVEEAIPAFILVITAFSFWYSLWYWEGMRVLKDASNLLNTFNFGRIHFLNAVIWYILFALSLAVINKRIKYTSLLVAFLVIWQLNVVFDQKPHIKYTNYNAPTFAEFYSETLFDEIKTYIGEDPEDYRVVSIGMHPAVSLYNDMYTLDLYVPLYPLSYKHEFREIIAGELEKNNTLKSYVDTWGGRLYVFVDELGQNYLFTKEKEETVNDLDFNTEKFKEMGGDYILSAVEIKNAGENNLELLNVFENDESAWRIYLYEAT